ncbi:sterol transporter [Maudiozyma humilis]|uniref:Phosphatidylglycerol/phosphatidylinositol transfer protein n=1 Tax=Maudiozyma humilis TaxID=51915 RepID=A0AAV5S0T9_MAUHU|nr:sterol transporter [Kazachstania humilis]
MFCSGRVLALIYLYLGALAAVARGLAAPGSFADGASFDALAAAPPGQSKPIAGGSPLQQCDLEEAQLLDVRTIELLPNPPQRGANLTIRASGKVLTTVEQGAYVDVEVRLGYIKLITQRFDLCEVLSENDIEGLECPVQPGEYDLAKIVQIPAEVPPGRYNVLGRAYTAKDELLTCITGDIVFPAVF